MKIILALIIIFISPTIKAQGGAGCYFFNFEAEYGLIITKPTGSSSASPHCGNFLLKINGYDEDDNFLETIIIDGNTASVSPFVKTIKYYVYLLGDNIPIFEHTISPFSNTNGIVTFEDKTIISEVRSYTGELNNFKFTNLGYNYRFEYQSNGDIIFLKNTGTSLINESLEYHNDDGDTERWTIYFNSESINIVDDSISINYDNLFPMPFTNNIKICVDINIREVINSDFPNIYRISKEIKIILNYLRKLMKIKNFLNIENSIQIFFYTKSKKNEVNYSLGAYSTAATEILSIIENIKFHDDNIFLNDLSNKYDCLENIGEIHSNEINQEYLDNSGDGETYQKRVIIELRSRDIVGVDPYNLRNKFPIYNNFDLLVPPTFDDIQQILMHINNELSTRVCVMERSYLSNINAPVDKRKLIGKCNYLTIRSFCINFCIENSHHINRGIRCVNGGFSSSPACQCNISQHYQEKPDGNCELACSTTELRNNFPNSNIIFPDLEVYTFITESLLVDCITHSNKNNMSVQCSRSREWILPDDVCECQSEYHFVLIKGICECAIGYKLEEIASISQCVCDIAQNYKVNENGICEKFCPKSFLRTLYPNSKIDFDSITVVTFVSQTLSANCVQNSIELYILIPCQSNGSWDNSLTKFCECNNAMGFYSNNGLCKKRCSVSNISASDYYGDVLECHSEVGGYIFENDFCSITCIVSTTPSTRLMCTQDSNLEIVGPSCVPICYKTVFMGTQKLVDTVTCGEEEYAVVSESCDITCKSNAIPVTEDHNLSCDSMGIWSISFQVCDCDSSKGYIINDQGDGCECNNDIGFYLNDGLCKKRCSVSNISASDYYGDVLECPSEVGGYIFENDFCSITCIVSTTLSTRLMCTQDSNLEIVGPSCVPICYKTVFIGTQKLVDTVTCVEDDYAVANESCDITCKSNAILVTEDQNLLCNSLGTWSISFQICDCDSSKGYIINKQGYGCECNFDENFVLINTNTCGKICYIDTDAATNFLITYGINTLDCDTNDNFIDITMECNTTCLSELNSNIEPPNVRCTPEGYLEIININTCDRVCIIEDLTSNPDNMIVNVICNQLVYTVKLSRCTYICIEHAVPNHEPNEILCNSRASWDVPSTPYCLCNTQINYKRYGNNCRCDMERNYMDDGTGICVKFCRATALNIEDYHGVEQPENTIANSYTKLNCVPGSIEEDINVLCNSNGEWDKNKVCECLAGRVLNEEKTACEQNRRRGIANYIIIIIVTSILVLAIGVSTLTYYLFYKKNKQSSAPISQRTNSEDDEDVVFFIQKEQEEL